MTLKPLALLAIVLPCVADTDLAALRALLNEIREKAPSSTAPRRALPQMTAVKHQLRDWVEAKLKALPLDGDEGDLERKLNAELGEMCCGDERGQKPCPDWSQAGFLTPIKLRRSGQFLILQTGIGIQCGFDESAYIFSRSNEGWRRIWQSEQNDYTEKAYKPQTIVSVLISPHSRANNYIVLTLGREPWCASNWHDVYYRAFRLGADLEAEPLFEGSDWAWVTYDPPIQGSISRDDILVECRIRSIDVDVHNRAAVRHYRIGDEDVERIDPLALSPRDFVDEWITHKWDEVMFWCGSENRRVMLDWHKKANETYGEFVSPTMHCPATPDLWQVAIDFSNSITQGQKQRNTEYFLVRWRPPFRFTMVAASDRPFAACTEEDPEADTDRTLFPGWN